MVDLRPRHRRALRHLAPVDRQHAVRCLRPAPGLHHVQVAEPVSRGDGGGAAVLAEPRDPARHLRARAQRPAGSLERHRALRPGGRAALREPPGPVPVGHHLLQPAARRRAGRCRRRHRRRRPQDRPAAHHPDHVHRHRAGLSGFARQRALPDRRGAGRGLPDARHPLRKLHPSRSPFSPRCPRPAWARCWRSCSPTPTSASSP